MTAPNPNAAPEPRYDPEILCDATAALCYANAVLTAAAQRSRSSAPMPDERVVELELEDDGKTKRFTICDAEGACVGNVDIACDEDGMPASVVIYDACPPAEVFCITEDNVTTVLSMRTRTMCVSAGGAGEYSCQVDATPYPADDRHEVKTYTMAGSWQGDAFQATQGPDYTPPAYERARDLGELLALMNQHEQATMPGTIRQYLCALAEACGGMTPAKYLTDTN